MEMHGNTYAVDWELREGLALRVAEATAAAERERLVRELRAARRARGAGAARPRWWARWSPRAGVRRHPVVR
ncbi:hypothetical protein AB1207_02455 [Kineococcus endophyticus]|uniref:Uncharacterized protein n=1 Tax=Kineococcus endophyticus TaxID=1181883 RepID=A0ABV3P1V4_9ACTN